MISRRSCAILLLLPVILFSFAQAGEREDKPRNIILLIGDGMGTAHLTLGCLVTGGLQAERMPVGGLIKTFPEGGLVTDSAASGTAMATGRKTRNGMISMSPAGDTLRTVLEYAEAAGMSTGLVATSSITHATPAAFASHVPDRGMEAEIARQMAGSGADVLIGGGWSYFVPADSAGSRRDDDLDLIAELRKRMVVVRTGGRSPDLEGLSSAAVFLAPRHCPAADGRSWSLAGMTEMAMEMLSRGEEGFFLMVEGSQIDWAAHDGDEEGVSKEMRDFDGAVGAALDFAERDGRTLVIMTADHETGGMAVDEAPDSQGGTAAKFTTGGHTMEMVPVLAFGPGAESFGGIHDNTFIGTSLISLISTR